MELQDALRKILEVQEPWYIVETEFHEKDKFVRVHITYRRGALFQCPVSGCNHNCKVHDSQYREFRHLDVCDYRCYIRLKLPRIHCPEHGVKTLKNYPFARSDSHFTYAFEQLILQECAYLPVLTVAKRLGESDKTLWRIFSHYVEKEKVHLDCSNVTRIGIDEKSVKKGHHYVSIFTDLDTGRVIFVTEGKDASVVARFYEYLFDHSGDPNFIKQVSIDMATGLKAGVEEFIPNAEIVYDRFHIKKELNKAVDQVRIQEAKENEELKGTKYLWLKNPVKLTDKQQSQLSDFLRDCATKTAKAYMLIPGFDQLWGVQENAVESLLKQWKEEAEQADLTPINRFIKTLKNHWSGIINAIKTKVTNAYAESLNSIFQLAKARARGFNNVNSFMNMVYFLGNKWDNIFIK